MQSTSSIVLVVFDSLRPDRITPKTMPALHAFIREGASWENSVCAFPSSTRVNAATLGSGCYPSGHGIVANRLYDPEVFARDVLNTGDGEHVARAERVHNGRFVTAPTLGDGLAQHNMNMTVISSGSPGNAHLINPRGGLYGHATLCLRDDEYSSPASLVRTVHEHLGRAPALTSPATSLMHWQTSLFLDQAIQGSRPEVTVLWYTEPDYTLHRHGLGSDEEGEVLACLDREFARILDWLSCRENRSRTCLGVLSDHGCITAGDVVDMQTELDGFTGRTQEPWIASVDSLTGLWTPPHTSGLDPATMEQWLSEQPWCDFLLGRPEQDNEKLADLGRVHCLHPRSPRLFTCLTSNDAATRNIPGAGTTTNPKKLGKSMHNGLHWAEMHTLLAMQGAPFQSSKRLETPASMADVAPTVLSLLGIDVPGGMQGRILSEGMQGDRASQAPTHEFFTLPGRGVRNKSLRFARLGDFSYLLGSEREREARS